jgi:hypothetical protein
MLRTRGIGKTGLAAAVVALALIGAHAASAAPAATQQATNDCWKTVVNDWLNNQPNLKGTYPVACYTQAIQHLSAYPDISQYSSAIDDIKRALLVTLHEDRGGGPPTSGGGFNPGPGGGTSGGSSGGSSGGGSGQGILGSIAKRLGPGNAQSIPLPLLVLGGLALLLLLTAAATWFTRRLQARRVTPAPAHARAGSVRPKT